MAATSIPRRPLGRTGQHSSIVALGGITLMQMEREAAVRLGHEALDSGVNHFDVAPSYGDAQLKMGEVLRSRRSEVFLACKTLKRDAAGARAELEESLRVLHAGHIDLYQFHALDTPEDLERICAPGGALEAFVDARRHGLIRHIGVTGHYPRMHMTTIERVAEIESVMFPLNFRTLDVTVAPGMLIEQARRRGLALLAIKATTRGEIGPTEDAYRWVLSQDIDLTLPAGAEFRQAVDVARDFQPMTAEEQAAFLDHCREKYELAKRF
jgi:aryl-alcohol dehydrogenase-like predicted oxidoreductase